MSINRRVYAFWDVPWLPRAVPASPENADRSGGKAEYSCLTLILLVGLAGLGWLSAAMLTGRALRDLFPYCC
jgi:hypothetical protein